ncbi:MAG: SEC-C metal-binding domain-containing protein, partial [Anaerolineae bacterium]
PCPCGSGLRFGQCHGWERELCGRSHRHARQGRPRPPVRAGVEGLAGSEPTG